jgi:hypothetical protein
VREADGRQRQGIRCLCNSLVGASVKTQPQAPSHSDCVVGTALTINFVAESRGATAQIILDGTNTARIDTFKSDVFDSQCAPQEWNSGALSNGNHVVTVTQLPRINDTTIGTAFVWIRNFVYAVV